MLTNIRAIVLHSFKYGDNKVIVELLTGQWGRMSCIAKVSKTGRGKVSKQCFQPLFIIEAVVDMRQKPGLQPMKEARVAEVYTSIPFEPRKTAIAMFTAEFLKYSTQREPADEAIFRYVEDSLLWLDGCDSGYANFHLVFMMRMARFFGFRPDTAGYEPGFWFDLRTGCFCPDAPMHHDSLPPDDARKMKALMRMNFPTMHLYRMLHQERNRAADVIVEYYRIHMPGFPELKSLPVLKELFG